MENIIEATDLEIDQEDRTVLSDVSFSMEKGEFVFLIGRTGTGKSSLLKTLYADLPLQKGSLHVAGVDFKGITPRKIAALRRKLGIIFQDFQLLYDRNVQDNFYFVLRATGWTDKQKMQMRIAQVMAQVGLHNAEGKMPYQLSGGEQQRVAIARALLNEPLLLIADEPTGNLDPEVSHAILEVFKAINRQGTAVLMATHNHTFLREYPTRILKCEDGRLQDSRRESITFIR